MFLKSRENACGFTKNIFVHDMNGQNTQEKQNRKRFRHKLDWVNPRRSDGGEEG